MIIATTVQEIVAIIEVRRPSIVGIDGVDGAGKSTLAKSLQIKTGYCLVHLDELLTHNQDTFLDAIDYDHLRWLLSTCPTMIVEGVCLKEVLLRVHAGPELFIYVQRLRYGLWADDIECNTDMDPSDFVKEERESAAAFADAFGGNATPSRMREEICHYHASFKPHRSADVIFQREEAS